MEPIGTTKPLQLWPYSGASGHRKYYPERSPSTSVARKVQQGPAFSHNVGRSRFSRSLMYALSLVSSQVTDSNQSAAVPLAFANVYIGTLVEDQAAFRHGQSVCQ